MSAELIHLLRDDVLYGGTVISAQSWRRVIPPTCTAVAVVSKDSQAHVMTARQKSKWLILNHHPGLVYILGPAPLSGLPAQILAGPEFLVVALRAGVLHLREEEVLAARKRLGREPSFNSELAARTAALRAVYTGNTEPALGTWIDHVCVRHWCHLATLRRKAVEFLCLLTQEADGVQWLGRLLHRSVATVQQIYTLVDLRAAIGDAITAMGPHLLGRWQLEPDRGGAPMASSRTVATLRWLRAHHTEPIGPGDAARAQRVQLTRLATMFRRDTGLTLGGCLRRLRVATAQELLADEQQSVTAVALACGFNGSDQFARVFRKATGASPLAWRRHARA